MDAMIEDAKGAKKSKINADASAGSNMNIAEADSIDTASEDNTYSSKIGQLVGPSKTVAPLNISTDGFSETSSRNKSLSSSPHADVKTKIRKPLPTLKTACERRMPNKRSWHHRQPGSGTTTLHDTKGTLSSIGPQSLPSSLTMSHMESGRVSQRMTGNATPISASNMRSAPEFDKLDAHSIRTQWPSDNYRAPAQYAQFATQALRLQNAAERQSKQVMLNEKRLDEQSHHYQQIMGPTGVPEAEGEEASRSTQDIQRPNKYVELPQSKSNDLRYTTRRDADNDSKMTGTLKDHPQAVMHYTLPEDLAHQREILALVFEGARQTIGEQPRNTRETVSPGSNETSPAQYLQPVRETQAQVATQDSWADQYPAEFQREWHLIERLVYTWHSDAHIHHEKRTKGRKAALKMLETELHFRGNVPRYVQMFFMLVTILSFFVAVLTHFHTLQNVPRLL
ncbi:hypothetical protein GGR57DRAFT_496288 [Xylariaceae sp. FL1272]|nr:hypothetical protein GGR57DRAFT_496288 [Xylariaceae sp. FL1272]